MTEEAQQKEPLFGLIAEVAGRNKQLVLLNLTFGRLIDEIVVPYDTDEAFFIDGVPVKKNDIRRIKIVSLTEEFQNKYRNAWHNFRAAKPRIRPQGSLTLPTSSGSARRANEAEPVGSPG